MPLQHCCAELESKEGPLKFESATMMEIQWPEALLPSKRWARHFCSQRLDRKIIRPDRVRPLSLSLSLSLSTRNEPPSARTEKRL